MGKRGLDEKLRPRLLKAETTDAVAWPFYKHGLAPPPLVHHHSHSSTADRGSLYRYTATRLPQPPRRRTPKRVPGYNNNADVFTRLATYRISTNTILKFKGFHCCIRFAFMATAKAAGND